MTSHNDFQVALRRKAMDDWLSEQKGRMALRFPLIDFDANYWPIRKLHNADQPDWYFTESLADFAHKDVSYRDALRCLVAEMVIAGKPKTIDYAVSPYRFLAHLSPHRIFDLTLEDIRQIEAKYLHDARANPASALRATSGLGYLEKVLLNQLASRGVIHRLGFYVRAEVRSELRKIATKHREQSVRGQGEELDRKMEAFNVAFNALVDNPIDQDGKPILSAMNREAICATTILMCAPSRINEPLCMSVDDHITVEDYAVRKIGEKDALHRTHQLLLMKGSKGAQWGAKPVLLFMMDALNYCIDNVRELGKRSRMLVEWYQKNPTTLYLPPELEHLRGHAITRKQLAQIVYMTSAPPIGAEKSAPKKYFGELVDNVFKGKTPNALTKEGKRNPRGVIDHISWADAEALLLTKVHEAMAACRRVTRFNHYQGDLSKMLFLFDSDEVPFLPCAITYISLKRCLKHNESDKKRTLPPTLFKKLNITMPVEGRIQIAEMDTHDPRRWLTTMGLAHGEHLSDVIFNKWANRSSLAQLKRYDKRSSEFKAEQAGMPEAGKLTELTDISHGLAAIAQLEEQVGLTTAIVTAHDAGIAMTSMDAVIQAIENRFVAKSSRGIIIIYPQRFGVCFHQHHEKPCRNYSNELAMSCVTCNEGAIVKGHIPTNEEIRTIVEKLFGSILRHLENLALTHNRSIADDPAALGEHMLTLVEKGLSTITTVQLANHLIENFHQLGHLLKDRLLASRLHQAFVARGVVKILDDQSISSGALIKYHNQTQHSEPLFEVALDAHGGREQVERDEQLLIAKYPQFTSKSLGLSDQRHLIGPENDTED